MRRHLLALIATLSIANALPGSEALSAAAPCESCHPAENAAHARTRMASAMVPVLQSAFAQNVGGLVLRESGNGYQFLYKKTESGVGVVAFRNGDSAVAGIRWVLGSGAQGQTPIVESGQTFFESRVSFFPQLQQYGITVGQSAAASSTAEAALGRPKTPAELSQCLGCHSVVLDSAFTRVQPGVQCEQCHPGANAHAAGHGKVLNPGKLSALQQVQLCGNCHRNTPPVAEDRLENVRFQPLRLMKSRCFESGKLACTTCHPAHQDAQRQAAAAYNGKCAKCHAGSALHGDARDTGNCIGCHMPQVELHPALRFTDHFIRVVQRGEYPAPGRIVARSGEPTTGH